MTKGKKLMKVTVLALMLCLLWGCAKEESDVPQQTKVTQKKQEKEYVYYYENRKISMGDEAEAVVKILGDDYEYFEAPSCAVEGMDMFYYYSNVTVVVNEIEGKKLVTGLWLLNDAVGTPEGIRIHSAYEEVLAAYGSDYEVKGSVLQYSGKESVLSIGITEGKVSTLEYSYP